MEQVSLGELERRIQKKMNLSEDKKLFLSSQRPGYIVLCDSFDMIVSPKIQIKQREMEIKTLEEQSRRIGVLGDMEEL